jgi:magnesium transporter
VIPVARTTSTNRSTASSNRGTARTGLVRAPLARTLPLRAVVPGRRHIPAHSSTSQPGTCSFLDAVIDWALYSGGVRQPPQEFEAACGAAQADDAFLWIGLHEPSQEQLEQLGDVFGLHPLALEDAANGRQRPKIERYDDMLFLALRTLAYVESDERDEGGDVVETGSVMVFVAEHAVITIRHGRHASMTGLRRRLETAPELLALGPSSVLHAVADKVVDDYLAVVDAVNEDIEEIETSVFGTRAKTDIERIYQLKRDVIEMKRTVGPLARPLRELSERRLLHPESRLVHPEIREYFRDVEDHLSRVRDQVASFDELLSSILQAGLARLTVSENEDMRKISAWVAIAAVPTMIAGIEGMNFAHMPELQTTWGYPAVLGTMVTVCAVLYRGFKRNGWL